ncbi:MAG: phosphoribosylanthranilate isomerase [Bacteroidetes bacterium]|nr:phosphoribosylanthranilate isomerase [Bacteroidota bacterium]MCL5026219.1 phosphoribosylanthranilate isomerase [Chloroflexota bacterium]
MADYLGANTLVRPAVKVKVCGITSLEDALAALQAGADALGFIFVPDTPRCVAPGLVREIVEQLPPFVTKVGVFADADLEHVRETMAECGLDLAQLHGGESPAYCEALFPRDIKSFRVKDAGSLAEMDRYPAAAYLLDTYVAGVPGGTGRSFDWRLARGAAAQRPIVLSGGLTPENVAEAVRTARPYAVDVGSGVEARPGVKDHEKLRAFVQAAKAALGSHEI